MIERRIFLSRLLKKGNFLSDIVSSSMPVRDLDTFGRGRDARVRALAEEVGLDERLLETPAAEVPPEVQARASRLLLHAVSLGFVHPVTGKFMTFESPPPF